MLEYSIRMQYAEAEQHWFRSYTSLKAIESSAVIQVLEDLLNLVRKVKERDRGRALDQNTR